MAQRRRRQEQERRRQRRITLLSLSGSLLLMLASLFISLWVFKPFSSVEQDEVSLVPSITYDASQPFSVADLTDSQLERVRQNGRIRVSDGPRGISVGDTLEALMACYPSTIVQTQDNAELTGEQSNEQIILYCADYFENRHGKMTVLPPRGLIDVNNGEIIVTLLSPTTPYPAGTTDDYGCYEHLYCIYNIQPATMTIRSITLGIDK